MKGKVYLVGAGPGDPDLLTVKALRLLKTADAVLYDDLVAVEILKLVPSSAQLYSVGKRCGTRKISQEEINFLMVSLTASGLKVVRLKSGDPLIFGRCGEEMEALRKAGVAHELVPGITAALGAAAVARIPLTHRHVSHALIFISAHAADKNQSRDWTKLVSSGATLAIYMPGRDHVELRARLIDAGLRADTPCAVVCAVTRPDQQMQFGTLEELPRLQPFPTPAVLLVGEVVGLTRRSGDDIAANHFLTGSYFQTILSDARRLASDQEVP